jgi:predicted glutamine amidotransferase
MCQLLGLNFNKPVFCRLSFRGFYRRSDANPDGWGLAFFPDEEAIVFKDVVKATESSKAEDLAKRKSIISSTFIGHVRKASSGAAIPCLEDTHPFKQNVNGFDYIFAHNGTLHGYESLQTGRYTPEGSTDSEQVFCSLMREVDERGIVNYEWREEDFRWMAELLADINSLGSINCLFSDGEHLFCYHDKSGYNGLSYTHRQPPYGPVKLLDEDWEVNLQREKNPEQTGYVIATKPLTKREKWYNFNPGQLIVIRDGRIIFSHPMLS